MRTQAKKTGANYRLLVAYDGTNFSGWQIQSNSDTVQHRIEVALTRILGEKVSPQGAGRTDAGVHAQGQVASFHSSRSMEPVTLVRALNANLPEDIRILRASPASMDFHARFSARSKEYRYRIWNAAVVDPFQRRYVLHHPYPLDPSAMRRVADKLVGRHDFATLSARPQRDVETTVRTISRMTITKRGALITVSVRADGFLYKMVRSIVGALLKAGRGEATTMEIERYLASRKRTHFVETAPAHGLILWKVWY